MLHATKKDAHKWKDLPLPYPPDKSEKRSEDISGTSQLPASLRGAIYRPDAVVR